MIARLACFSALFLAAPDAAGPEYYVALDGNDAWSGTLAAPSKDKSDGPFATLTRARDEVRKARAAGEKGTVTVHVRAGLHALAGTFKLGPQDSGTAEGPTLYRAHLNEKPILIGGRRITGWVPHKDRILKADLAAQGFGKAAFTQLVMDGKRQPLARYPDFDPKNPYGGGWAYADGKPVPMYQDVPGETRRVFQLKAGDWRAWSRPEEGEVFVFARYNWWNNIVRIAKLDRETRTVTLAGDASYPIRPGDRYYLQNLVEELDSPGEWYLDRATQTLYFWPPSPVEKAAVYAPTMRTILEIEKGAAHVQVRGFTIEGAEGTAVTLKETTRCLVAGCTIRNVGDYHGSGVSIEGGRENGVAGCDIHDIGSHGVHLSGGDVKTLTAAGNYADNNYIHHFGVYYKQGCGISMRGVGHRASHNYIHDGPRMGIIFGGNNLLLEYNRIRHVNLETEDTGAVYTGGRDWLGSRGSVIRHNYFHDILGYGQHDGKWVSPYFAWGVYLDDNTGGVDVIGNVVARCTRAGIHLHNGRDNWIENNLFVDNGPQQVEYNGWTGTHSFWTSHFPTMVKGYESVAGEPAWKNMRNMDLHPSKAVLPDGLIMSGNRFVRNIVSVRDPAAASFRFRNLPLSRYESDYNLLWHHGQPIRTGFQKAGKDLSENLLKNPGFEDGAAGAMPPEWHWQAHPREAKAAAVEESPAAGKRCLRLDGALETNAQGKTANPILASAHVPAAPGKTYRLSARMKADKAGAKAALFAQSYIAHVYYWAKDQGVTLGTEWKPFELVVKLPSKGESGFHEKMDRLQIRIDFREPSGTLWVDEASIREAEALDEWESWKAQGFDRNSLVADPLIVAPEKGDYRLKPESPAFRLGFKPIPFEKIGLYADPRRASWPVAEAEGAREHPLSAGR
jgi:parallel beta-helix repeat protein